MAKVKDAPDSTLRTAASSKAKRARLTPEELIPRAGLCLDGDQTFAVEVRTGSQTEKLTPVAAVARAGALRQAAADIEAMVIRASRANNTMPPSEIEEAAAFGHELPQESLDNA